MGAGPSTRMTATKYHQQVPSGSSFGSSYMLDESNGPTSTDYQNGQEGYGDAYSGLASAALASSTSSNSLEGQQASRDRFYQNTYNACPTRELSIPSLVKSDSKNAFRSPFDDDEQENGLDPMPHSPTMVPTLLQRRTTDPFSNKHSLRVINVDDDREPGTPTSSTGNTTPIVATPRIPAQSNQNLHQEESRPFSNWSSLAPSRASTGTMSDAYSTFHFDSFGGAGGTGGNTNGNGGGRISRAGSLDATERLRIDHNLPFKRSSSSLEFVARDGEILTPRQVSDVGFFRDV